MERITNGYYRSTLHRVLIEDDSNTRYSIAFFFEPSRDATVSCAPEFYSESNPPKYEPIVYGQYLADKYEASHIDYKVSMTI